MVYILPMYLTVDTPFNNNLPAVFFMHWSTPGRETSMSNAIPHISSINYSSYGRMLHQNTYPAGKLHVVDCNHFLLSTTRWSAASADVCPTSDHCKFTMRTVTSSDEDIHEGFPIRGWTAAIVQYTRCQLGHTTRRVPHLRREELVSQRYVLPGVGNPVLNSK